MITCLLGRCIQCLNFSLLLFRYPADLFRRAKINSVLDWHHSNLRRGAGINLHRAVDCVVAMVIEFSYACALLVIVFQWLLCFCFSATYVLNTVLAPVLGIPASPQAAVEAEKLLSASLSKIESIWLKGNGKFLLGGFQPSIADLSLVCEIMQLEVYNFNSMLI